MFVVSFRSLDPARLLLRVHGRHENQSHHQQRAAQRLGELFVRPERFNALRTMFGFACKVAWIFQRHRRHRRLMFVVSGAAANNFDFADFPADHRFTREFIKYLRKKERVEKSVIQNRREN